MNPLQAIALGAVQGLTEFIPVSSSGHLELVPRLFGWPEASTIFILFSHIGTLLALLIYFRKTILNYLQVLWRWLRKQDTKKDRNGEKVILNVILATIPAGVIGFLGEQVLSNLYDNPAYSDQVLVITLVAMAFLGLVFIVFHKLIDGKRYEIHELSKSNALFIGGAQVLALIRGTSRSGVTVLAAQVVGLSRVAAAEFSFLMSIPIISAVCLYGVYKLLKLPAEQMQAELAPALIGAISSFVFGYLAVSFMLKYLKKNNLVVFGWYRLFFVLICVLLLVL